jgi:hypothetical protein
VANSVFLNIPYLTNAQLNKYDSINDVIKFLDSLVFARVFPTPITAVPISPLDGVLYLIASGGSGILAGHGGDLLYYTDGGATPNIVVPVSDLVLGGYYTDSTDWKNDILKEGVLTVVSASVTMAVPNTPLYQSYRILVTSGSTLTLTSSLTLIGTSLVLTAGIYDVIVNSTHIYIR